MDQTQTVNCATERKSYIPFYLTLKFVTFHGYTWISVFTFLSYIIHLANGDGTDMYLKTLC